MIFRNAGLISLLVLVFWCSLLPATEHPSRPNIILILADDLGYGDLGCYGQRLIKTPRLDQLACEGLRFTQAYSGSSVCTPSRASLMTGFHNGHSPARDNIPHYSTYLEDRDLTIAEVLSPSGYRCAGVGKWSLGDAGSVGIPTLQGFSSWFGYLNQDHAHYYFPEYLDDDPGILDLSGNGKSRHSYSHHLMIDRTLDVIRRSKESPFFMYAALTLPHFSSSREDPTRLTVPSDAPYSDAPWPQSLRNYAAMVTLLDKDVGRIVDLIDELGLRENTLIVFTSDNGPWGELPGNFLSTAGLRGAKRDLYEGGIRVPLIVRQPGTVPAGRVSTEVIAAWDLFPTFAELAGIVPPQGIDGVSMAQVFRGLPQHQKHEFLYWDYGHCRTRYDQAVRLDHWKGIRLGRQAPLELYDLNRDPQEKHNLADQHPDIVRKIEEAMQQAVAPHPKYPVGEIYRGKSLWKPGKVPQEFPPPKPGT